MLVSNSDNSEDFVLIDYEFAGWNPRTIDLAVYLNENICDNAHPEGSGIKYYFENTPSDEIIEFMVRQYFDLMY